MYNWKKRKYSHLTAMPRCHVEVISRVACGNFRMKSYNRRQTDSLTFKSSIDIPFFMSLLSVDTTSNSRRFALFPFRRKKNRYVINPPNRSYSVIYLGNVLTALAKGNESIQKPLCLMWRTYCSKQRFELPMKLSVTRSGLKVETRQLGLTEYCAHRITYCAAPINYPRLFCWIYKHDGKRMKPDIRCHAVLCKKLSDALKIEEFLRAHLQAGLQEYRREKIATQNSKNTARMMGQELVIPKRKLLLQTGIINFRPPLSSKQKRSSRLEIIDEEDGESLEVDRFVEIQQDEELSDYDSLCCRRASSSDEDCASSSNISASSSILYSLSTSANQLEAENVETTEIDNECTSYKSLPEVASEPSTEIGISTLVRRFRISRARKRGSFRYADRNDSTSDESGYQDISNSDGEPNVEERECKKGEIKDL